jgi:hypothetical protein
MNCQNCWSEVPAGTGFCPNCGTPVTNQGIPPTMAVPAPPPPLSGSYTPPPSTDYGQSPYDTPQSPYGAPQPPYSAPQSPYGAPQSPYGAPQPYPAPGGYMPPQPVRPKKMNGCVIALIIVLVFVFVIGGGIVAVVAVAANKVGGVISSAAATENAGLTAIATDGTTTSNAPATAPDASQIDATAAQNITSATSASNVDSNAKPTDHQTSFTIGSTAYVAMDFAGNAGYAEVQLYRDGDYDVSSEVLQVDDGDVTGAFSFTINNPGSFVAGVYWCTQSDCSDAALAQIVNFTAA